MAENDNLQTLLKQIIQQQELTALQQFYCLVEKHARTKQFESIYAAWGEKLHYVTKYRIS